MDDRVDAFARLNRLRTEGVLTDAEYEREKAALMGEDSPSDPSPSQRWADGWEATKGMRRSLRWSFLGCVIVIGLIGTYFFGKARTLAEARGELSGSAYNPGESSAQGGSLFGSESPWAVQTKTDPMTDAVVRSATATFEGAHFNVEVGVTCSSTGDVTYTATSFDKNGQSAEMRAQANFSRRWIPFQFRLDGQKPIDWSYDNPAYNNQIRIDSNSHLSPMLNLAGANHVRFRLFMTSGEETVDWSQDDENLQKVLSPCVAQQAATREQEVAEDARKKAAQRDVDQAYIDRLYDDPSVDADTLIWLAQNRNIPIDNARLAQKREGAVPQKLPLP